MPGIYSFLDDKNLIGEFYTTLEERFSGSWASRVGWMTPSDMELETYKWLGRSPQMREWIGERQAKQLEAYSYQLRNKEFESLLEIPKADMRRDKTSQHRIRIMELADIASDHWEDLLVSLINSNGLAYDGQNFFDTDHDLNPAATQKNEISATEIPSANVGSATAPTADEAAKIINEMTGYFMTLKDENGRAMNGRARSFMLMVSTMPLWAAFNHALGADNLTSGQTNVVSGLKRNGFTYDIVLRPDLTSATTKVRMFRTDGRLKPFILQDEVPITPDEEDPGITKKYVFFGVTATRNAGYGMWEQALSCTLS
jgi:phage major head subunit gpT-like protein